MTETREQLGEIVAAHRLAHDCLLLLGWSAETLTGDGMAALEDRRQDRGRVRAASWLGPGARGRPRLAARVPAISSACMAPAARPLLSPACRRPCSMRRLLPPNLPPDWAAT